jgi:urease accessory protein
MCVVVSRSDETEAASVHGVAILRFARSGVDTRLADLYQRAPLRVLFPQALDQGVPTAVAVTTTGGLVGGDRLDLDVAVDDGAAAVVTAQAAEKVYRSLGADCRIRVRLTAEPGSWLEWLPQETILFEGARLRRTTLLDVAPTARVMAGEMLVFGRTASGETLSRGLVRDAWEVRRGGRLEWMDALHMEGDLAAPLSSAACFAGAKATATMIYAADDSGARLDLAREQIREYIGEDVKAAATVVGGVLVVRWLGRDGFSLRTGYGGFWAAFRNHVGGLRAALPRVWCV